MGLDFQRIDLAQVKEVDPALGGRDSAVLGVSYSLKKFTGRLAVGADRATGDPIPALRKGDKYSLDVGGSYDLSRRVALTGGVRYNVERERLSALLEPRWMRVGGYWFPRGGIPIDVFWQTGAPPAGLFLPDQGVPPYRGR